MSISRRTPQVLTDDINRATQILVQFTNEKNRDVQMLIPPSVLASAHGLMIVRLTRVGLVLSAKRGTGIIIARLPDGSWSAPSGISVTAFGYGQQAGAEVIDSVIVMNYRAAIKTFIDGGGQLQLGVNASISAGPLGRAVNMSAGATSATHVAATYSYSTSKGLFAGYSLEGSKVSERVNSNAAFYGRVVTASEILTGKVVQPQQAYPLYNLLNSIGAGPRPGLPFAPKKGNPYTMEHQRQQQQMYSDYRPSPAPEKPILGAALQTADGGGPVMISEEEPPPPYTPPPASAPPHPQDEKQNRFGYSRAENETKQSPNLLIGAVPQMEGHEPSPVVIAKYSYSSQEPGDISFEEGDCIIVTKRNGGRDCWWEGEIGTRRGFFPANYTEDLN